MECLTGDHTPKTDPRHNLVITAPPYKTRGGSTIAQGGLLYSIQKVFGQQFFSSFRPPAVPLPRGSLPAPPAAAKGGPRWPPATQHSSGKLRRRERRAEPPGRTARPRCARSSGRWRKSSARAAPSRGRRPSRLARASGGPGSPAPHRAVRAGPRGSRGYSSRGPALRRVGYLVGFTLVLLG